MLSSGLFIGVCGLNDNVSEHTVCSEMLAFRLQALVNHPEESKQHGVKLFHQMHIPFVQKQKRCPKVGI
jgi:hypothetical protein